MWSSLGPDVPSTATTNDLLRFISLKPLKMPKRALAKAEATPSTSKRLKQSTPEPIEPKIETPSKAKASPTLLKKMKALDSFKKTPFPDHERPSSEECQAVCDALATVHHLPVRPETIVKSDSVASNCGLVPDVLDALIRFALLLDRTSEADAARAEPSCLRTRATVIRRMHERA